jgi:hypothetical protein
VAAEAMIEALQVMETTMYETNTRCMIDALNTQYVIVEAVETLKGDEEEGKSYWHQVQMQVGIGLNGYG